MSGSSPPKRRKRGPPSVPENGPELGERGTEAGEPLVLTPKRGPKEAGIVGSEGDGDAGREEPPNRVRDTRRDGPGRLVRGQADVESDAPAGQQADHRTLVDGPDAVGDAMRTEKVDGLGDRVRAGPLARVNKRKKTEPTGAPKRASKLPKRNRQFVAAESEAASTGPGTGLQKIENPVSGVGSPLPHGVEKHDDAPSPQALVSREDGFDGVPHTSPLETNALDENRRDVDLGVEDALPVEAPGDVPRDPGVVAGVPKLATHIAIEIQEAAAAGEKLAPFPNGGDVGEARGTLAGDPDQGRRGDRTLQVDVQLGLAERPETSEERAMAVGHRVPSYRPRGLAEPATATGTHETLWIRSAAFGVDLIVYAGFPLLLSATLVFGYLLLVSDPSESITWVFRLAQAAFVAGFLARDRTGASPGKSLLGIRVVARDGALPGFRRSLRRNLPLLIPGWNLVEAFRVLRFPRQARPGDRLAGTLVTDL